MNNNLGIASLVLGILSIVFFFLPYISIILGPAAIVLAVLQNKRNNSITLKANQLKNENK